MDIAVKLFSIVYSSETNIFACWFCTNYYIVLELIFYDCGQVCCGQYYSNFCQSVIWVKLTYQFV